MTINIEARRSLQQGPLADVCPASELLGQPVGLRRLALHVGFLGLCLVQLSGAGSPEETTLNSRGRYNSTLPTGGDDEVHTNDFMMTKIVMWKVELILKLEAVMREKLRHQFYLPEQQADQSQQEDPNQDRHHDDPHGGTRVHWLP